MDRALAHIKKIKKIEPIEGADKIEKAMKNTMKHNCDELEIESFVYKITNLINKKVYIGKTTTSLRKLLIRYKKECKYYYAKGSIRLIIRAMLKYGMHKFEVEILEVCQDPNRLDEREMFWISEIDSNNRNVGYNLTIGGEGVNGLERSEESRKRLSNICKLTRNIEGSNNPFYGKTHTELVRQKVAESNRRRKGEKYGPHTAAMRKKISNGRKGKCIGARNHKSRQYKIIDPNNTVYFITGGLDRFCQQHGLNSKGLLLEVAKGTRENYKGWRCYYLDQEISEHTKSAKRRRTSQRT